MSPGCLAGPGEPLAKHLLEVAQCLEGEKVTDYIACKLARVFNTSVDEAFDVIVLAGLLHDVGKSHEDYRESEREGYFPLHEKFSVIFTYHLILTALSDLPELSPATMCNLSGENLYTVLLASVAIHHYASKPYKSKLNYLQTFRPRCDDYRSAFEAWRPRSEIGEHLKLHALDLIGRELEDTECYQTLINSLDSRVKPKILYATSAVLGILGRCDNLVASRNRDW